jgi:hypothetical protein
MKKNLLISSLLLTSSFLLILIVSPLGIFAQGANKNGADRNLRGSGRVNSSTLATEVDIPIGGYPGRGLNLPINLSYSSKVWRMEAGAPQPIVNSPGCLYPNSPVFGENSAGGWTSSLQIPYVEYSALNAFYDANGRPVSEQCLTSGADSYGYIRRLMIHLPGGETHEMRMNDDVIIYPSTSNCTDPNSQQCNANDINLPANWTGWYTAADGSNLRYYEDRANNVYYLLLPDGSKLDFSASTQTSQTSVIRAGTRLTERNGNFITYNQPTTQYPNGSWTDTLGEPSRFRSG